jgi:hypothetical protein
MKTPLPEPFEITDDMRRWAQAKVPNVDIDGSTEEFCDYWRATGKRMVDWTATWRNWMRRTPDFTQRYQKVTRTSGLTSRRAPVGPPANLYDNSPRFKRH